jgi:predicted 3-demethylubiquinone-9 3-methyltransferase (glyoxalase superfamily)
MKKITPCLWFDDQGEAAANFYTSIFPGSKIGTITRFTDVGPRTPGMVLTVDFELSGQKFVALNGGPEFKFSEAVSFQVMCKDQAEIDDYWSKLSAGGQEGECGWLKDKFGLSWQIVPKALHKMIADPDPARVNRVMAVMLKMKKLDLKALKRAYRAERVPVAL